MNNTDNAIEVRQMSKDFKVVYDKPQTLKERLLSLGRKQKPELHHVLKNINVEIKKGETVALIGTNGSGKSTLLKLMTKILYPTQGELETSGKLTSLLELGAGFHPDFSGRENIYFNASIFGLTRKEIEERLDAIIEFSELEGFIDNPVRTYSSGMYMRLAFSIAINVSGNVIYSQNEILKMIGLNYHEKSILYPSFYLEYKLKKNDLIKSCKVTKTFGGGVYIHVVEQSIVGYYYEGKVPYVLLSSGDKVKMDVDNINLITSPYINGLNDEQRQKLCRYIKKLDNSDMKLISEIRHYSSSYDNDMLELIMVDGHKVHTSYSGLKLMNSYRDILKGLNSTLQCIEIVEETNSAYSQNCK